MAKNQTQENFRIQFTATEAVTSGQGYLLQATFGVIQQDAAIGELAVLDAQPGHVYELPCKSTDVVSIGNSLYWDDGAGELTLTATANMFAGKAVTASPNGVAIVEVALLNGNPNAGA